MPSKRSKKKAESVEQMAYRFIGYPDEDTAHTLSSFCGAARFLWNRFLADSRDFYDIMGTRLNPMPADYKDVEGLEWLNTIDSIALCNVQLNFEAAMNAFFNHRSGFPKFKKKGRCKESYKTNISNNSANNLRLDGNMLKLPKVDNEIRLNLHRAIRPGGILKNCTVTRENEKWYFSLVFEYPKPARQIPDPSADSFRHIGLDMSLPKLYVDSAGQSPQFMKAYAKSEAKLARAQRTLSRKKISKDGTPSNNYRKQKARVSRLYTKTKHQREDMLHKISAFLTDQYNLISIEDLDIAAMKQSLSFGKSVSDLGWGMFTNMLAYKQERKGHALQKVSRWFPSSRLCSNCGHVHKDLKIGDRTYICPVCGHAMGRDLQAARNIDQEGLQLYQAFYKTERKQAA